MELSAHAKLLASIPMFSSVPPEDIEDLTHTLTVRDIEAGGDVFRQGDKGSKLYVIVTGEVEISVGEGERRLVLASLHKGQYFGEMSILDGSPRSAAARAPKATSLLELDRREFVEFLKRRPLASIYIMAELGDRMRATNDLMARQLTKGGTSIDDAAPGSFAALSDRLAGALGSPAAVFAFLGVALLAAAPHIFLGPQGEGAAGRVVALLSMALLGGVGIFLVFLVPLILYTLNRQTKALRELAQKDFRVNLKNEVSIEAILRKQGETLARVALIERRLGLDIDGAPK